MWVAKGKIWEKEFGEDLSSALELRDKLLKGRRKVVTLRSRNRGYPVPGKYKGKMMQVNRKGYAWCPYCMKLHRFEKRQGFYFEGMWIDKAAYYCPMCDVSSTDGNVLRFNPLYATLAYRRRSRGRSKKRSGKRRR